MVETLTTNEVTSILVECPFKMVNPDKNLKQYALFRCLIRIPYFKQ